MPISRSHPGRADKPIYAVCLVLILLCTACSKWDFSPTIPTHDYAGRGMALGHWLVIGPLVPPDKTDSWTHDFLAAHPGALQSSGEFRASLRKLSIETRDAPMPVTTKRVDDEAIDFDYVYDYAVPSKGIDCAAYAACDIEVEKGQEAYLLLASADTAKVWLNGERVPTERTSRGLVPFQEAFPVTFRPGRNFLVIETIHWRNAEWGLIARIEPNAVAASLTALDTATTTEAQFVRRVSYLPGQAIVLRPRGVPAEQRFQASLKDRDHATVARFTFGGGTDRWRIPASLPEGIYSLSLELGGREFSQSIFVGNIAEYARAVMDRIAAARGAGAALTDLESLRQRLDILVRAEESNEATPEQQIEHKLIVTLAQATAELDAMQHGHSRGAFSGLQLRGFRSAIDGNLQSYRLFMPAGHEKMQGASPVPLVVICPPQTQKNRPFVASPFMADQDGAEHFASLAAKYDLALVWSGYRNSFACAPSELAHLDEVLRDVEGDYEIDPHRMYLAGMCTGCNLETRAAVFWPRRFAAVAVYNPIFLDRRYYEGPAQSESRGFQQWLSDPAGLGDFFHGPKVPTYVLYDGEEFGQSVHRENTVAFIDRAKQARVKPEYDFIPRRQAQHYDGWSRLFGWLAHQRRADVDTHENPAAALWNDSISRALAQPFVVVLGTGGTPADRVENQRILGEFQAAWQQAHFGEAPVVSDVSFDFASVGALNAVLIGNPETNSVWRRWGDALPVQVSTTGVSAGMKKWEGGTLSVQALAVMPGHPERRVVLIGGPCLQGSRFGVMDLSLNGWFSAVIWRTGENGVQAVEIRDPMPSIH